MNKLLLLILITSIIPNPATAETDCKQLEFAEINSYNKSELIDAYCTYQNTIKRNEQFNESFKAVGAMDQVRASLQQNMLCHSEIQRLNGIAVKKFKKRFTTELCNWGAFAK